MQGFTIKMKNNIPEVTVQDVFKNGQNALLIDCRQPDEFNAELGHVKDSKLVTLGLELQKYLSQLDVNKNVIFICRSGNRSGTATNLALQLGFKNVANMTGGMIEWNEQKLPTEKQGTGQ